jgi:hypothetical protein
MANGGFMDTESIIAEIGFQISQLKQAQKVLLDGSGIKQRRSRPKGIIKKTLSTAPKRVLSAEAKARIAAQMERWGEARRPRATSFETSAQ